MYSDNDTLFVDIQGYSSHLKDKGKVQKYRDAFLTKQLAHISFNWDQAPWEISVGDDTSILQNRIETFNS